MSIEKLSVCKTTLGFVIYNSATKTQFPATFPTHDIALAVLEEIKKSQKKC